MVVVVVGWAVSHCTDCTGYSVKCVAKSHDARSLSETVDLVVEHLSCFCSSIDDMRWSCSLAHHT